jgi:segregation and condensation protein B
METKPLDTADIKRIIEVALICHTEPLAVSELRVLFAGEVDAQTVQTTLRELQLDWVGRGLELIQVATGWRFQSRPEMQVYLERLYPEKTLKYSRAVLETLAIVAYRQPVTRGDMEEIRGVTINSSLIRQLEERGWIETVGCRETVGRPALFATTRRFLDDLGIRSLEELPSLDGLVQPAAATAPSPAEPIPPTLAQEPTLVGESS